MSNHWVDATKKWSKYADGKLIPVERLVDVMPDVQAASIYSRFGKKLDAYIRFVSHYSKKNEVKLVIRYGSRKLDYIVPSVDEDVLFAIVYNQFPQYKPVPRVEKYKDKERAKRHDKAASGDINDQLAHCRMRLDRLCWWLHVIEQYTYAEIGDVLDVSVTQVSHRVKKYERRLKAGQKDKNSGYTNEAKIWETYAIKHGVQI